MAISEHIRALVATEFDARHHDAIIRQLSRYGWEPSHREVDRVHEAILTLAAGDAGRIEHLVAAAVTDYRDVLYWLTFDDQGHPPPLSPASTAVETRTPPDIPPDQQLSAFNLRVLQPPGYSPVAAVTSRSGPAGAAGESTRVARADIRRVGDRRWQLA